MVYYLSEDASVLDNVTNTCMYIKDIVNEAQMGYVMSNYTYLKEEETTKPKAEATKEKDHFIRDGLKKIWDAVKRFFKRMWIRVKNCGKKIKRFFIKKKMEFDKHRADRMSKKATNLMEKQKKYEETMKDLNDEITKNEAEIDNLKQAEAAGTQITTAAGKTAEAAEQNAKGATDGTETPSTEGETQQSASALFDFDDDTSINESYDDYDSEFEGLF